MRFQFFFFFNLVCVKLYIYRATFLKCLYLWKFEMKINKIQNINTSSCNLNCLFFLFFLNEWFYWFNASLYNWNISESKKIIDLGWAQTHMAIIDDSLTQKIYNHAYKIMGDKTSELFFFFRFLDFQCKSCTTIGTQFFLLLNIY